MLQQNDDWEDFLNSLALYFFGCSVYCKITAHRWGIVYFYVAVMRCSESLLFYSFLLECGQKLSDILDFGWIYPINFSLLSFSLSIYICSFMSNRIFLSTFGWEF